MAVVSSENPCQSTHLTHCSTCRSHADETGTRHGMHTCTNAAIGSFGAHHTHRTGTPCLNHRQTPGTQADKDRQTDRQTETDDTNQAGRPGLFIKLTLTDSLTKPPDERATHHHIRTDAHSSDRSLAATYKGEGEGEGEGEAGRAGEQPHRLIDRSLYTHDKNDTKEAKVSPQTVSSTDSTRIIPHSLPCPPLLSRLWPCTHSLHREKNGWRPSVPAVHAQMTANNALHSTHSPTCHIPRLTHPTRT